jgi:hypothetical protein
MKKFIRTISLLSVLLGVAPLFAQIAKPCTSSFRLSDDEAQILLYMTPEAVTARKAGTDVDIERSAPTQQYPAADFFSATLVSRKPTAGSVLGNGVLGTFSVNRHTGEVESTGDFTTVKGRELDRVRAWLLHSHCAPR